MTEQTFSQADLDACAREPIHIPGYIQPHGLLLVLSEPDLIIQQISANTSELLGQPADSLLGQPLAALIGLDNLSYLRNVLAHESIDENPIFVWSLHLHGARQLFDGLAHRHNGVLILEFEPTIANEQIARDFFRTMKTALGRLQRTTDFAGFCAAAAHEVQALTGFDRVMIYQFDASGNGQVIAEALHSGLESFLGLHYPASDIPPQARELYLRNWVRLIAAVHYAPAPIVPTLTPTTNQPLDLSYASLRSVSPIHIEYLGNMGVGASMSISLIKDGQLWGLIACHHYAPNYVPYSIRNACEFLGQAVSLQLSSKVDSGIYQYSVHIKDTAAQLIEQMSQQNSWVSALIQDAPNLLSLIHADGAAICQGKHIQTLGRTPGPEPLAQIADWLETQFSDQLFATNSLSSYLPEAVAWKDTACGLLAVPINHELGEYVMWFRGEVLQTVDWGGEPTKAVVVTEHGKRLSPRKSFARWRQEVALHANPWLPIEQEAATNLCNAIQHVVMRRIAELSQLNTELLRSNSELDAFAYVASHDLKEPLRGLHNFAHFLIEDYGEKLDETGHARLRTMIRLTQRMDTLIDSLLHFSRVGRAELTMQEIDLNHLLDDVLEGLANRLEQARVTVRRPMPLPHMRCDAVRVSEVLSNLISNAAKYTSAPEPWVEIGVLAPDDPANAHGISVLYVRDNGIGIQARHFETIFRIFKRLHGQEQFGGGAGAGLTIARKIIERHGGVMWVASEPGAGTTFFFTLEEPLHAV